MKNISVLSLFDGMSCGQQALSRIKGIKVDNYYSSEINIYAQSVTKYNFPETNFIGDVTQITIKKLDTKYILLNDKYKINTKELILIGGSPCQGFSFAGKQKGAITKSNIEVCSLEQYLKLKDEKFEFEGQSYLFWEYIRILEEIKIINPEVKFLLENVKMKNQYKEMFDKTIGQEPIEINSNLVSAQNRKRYYWTNINNIQQPTNQNIILKDILQNYENVDEKYFLNNTNLLFMNQLYGKKTRWLKYKNDLNSKAGTAVATMSKGLPRGVVFLNEDIQNQVYLSGIFNNIDKNIINKKNKCKFVRKFTPIEYERLQTVKDDYTKYGINKQNIKYFVSDTQRYAMIGNGWTVSIIENILKSLL